MCGITGALAFTEEGKKHLDRIDDAVKALRHRGPDGEGIFRDENVVLGHTRLAIIDTSEFAAQPFTTADGRYTIVFNGEIFNFRELRAELEDNGVKFRSQSDTEVLVELFAAHHRKALEKLNGFFAFAVWDHVSKKLFLARDRYGVKPLYCYYHKDYFVFGSEMKALFAFGIPRKLHTPSLQYYLQLNYLPPWEAMAEGCFPLQPGEYAVVKDWGNTPYLDKTWYELPNQDAKPPLPYEKAKTELAEKLEEAVTKRLVSDVPLGSFLSGGIDSSIIAALAKRHKDELQTFSIGFADEPYFDETKYAEMVAKHIGSQHHVFRLTNKDLLESLLEFLENCDEPFADSSALAVNILSKETRKHVTVALSGDGADELLAGYNKHRAEFLVRNGNWKNSIVKMSSPLLAGFTGSRNSKLGNRVRQLKRFSEGLSLTPQDRYWRWASFCSEEEARAMLIHPHLRSKIEQFKWERIFFGKSEKINDILRNDMKMVLTGDMLVKVDRSSMLHALEVRTPFLDVNMVEFIMRLPSEYKIDAHHQKKILKDAFADLLPAEIFTRKKQGFEVPLLKWFKTDLRGMIDELLNEKFLKEQNIFHTEEIKKIRTQMESNNPGDSVARIWALIVFQKWWMKYVRET